MKSTLTFILTLILLSSCDCYQHVSGTVVDKETGQVLRGVTIYNKKQDWNKTVSDSLGHFELSAVSGGFRCPPMTVIANMEHYEQTELSIPSGGQAIIKMKSITPQKEAFLEKMQGQWYHDEDSLATVRIIGDLWVFKHQGNQTTAKDTYTISFTNRLPGFTKEDRTGDFITLTNETDAMYYEILGLTDSSFSLISYPAGKMYLYRRNY